MNAADQLDLLQIYHKHGRVQMRRVRHNDGERLDPPHDWVTLPERSSTRPDEVFDFYHFEYRRRPAMDTWYGVYNDTSESLLTGWVGSPTAAISRAMAMNEMHPDEHVRAVRIEISDVTP